jgi:hypothetical protein
MKPFTLIPMAALFTSCCTTKSPVPEVTSHHGGQPVVIEALTWWNDTGVALHKDRSYQFKVTGTWTDCTYQADANGPVNPLINILMFPTRPLLRFSPFRDCRANYFQPIGTIGRGKGHQLPAHAFIIRDGMKYTAPASGILHVFANDVPWERAYSNNKGQLSLTVTEIH